MNGTDLTLTYNSNHRINVRLSPWKIVLGVISFGATITDNMGFDADDVIAPGGESEGDVQDNTSNLYWGIKGFIEVKTGVPSGSGPLYLYLEKSDDNSNWPSDGADFDIEKHMHLIAVLEIYNSVPFSWTTRVNFIIK